MKKIIVLIAIVSLLFTACSSSELESLRKENASLKEEVSRLKEDNETINGLKVEVEKMIVLNQDLQKKNAELSKLDEKLKEQEDKYKALEDELKSKVEEMETLKDELSKSLAYQEDKESKLPVLDGPFVSLDDLLVTVVSKYNVPKDTGNYIYKDKVVMMIQVENKSAATVSDIRGELMVKDAFGKEILSMHLVLSGQTVKPYSIAQFPNIEFEINEFNEAHKLFYRTNLESLTFEYQWNSIVTNKDE